MTCRRVMSEAWWSRPLPGQRNCRPVEAASGLLADSYQACRHPSTRHARKQLQRDGTSDDRLHSSRGWIPHRGASECVRGATTRESERASDGVTAKAPGGACPGQWPALYHVKYIQKLDLTVESSIIFDALPKNRPSVPPQPPARVASNLCTDAVLYTNDGFDAGALRVRCRTSVRGAA